MYRNNRERIFVSDTSNEKCVQKGRVDNRLLPSGPHRPDYLHKHSCILMRSLCEEWLLMIMDSLEFGELNPARARNHETVPARQAAISDKRHLASLRVPP